MRRYEQTDLEELSRWCVAQGHPAPDIYALPLTGFIEPGVAAGFLYLTDSSGALMGGFVTNREASPEARNLALEVIAKAVIDAADGLGVATLTITTIEPSIVERAKRHGFQDVGRYTMLIREVPHKRPLHSIPAKEKVR